MRSIDTMFHIVQWPSYMYVLSSSAKLIQHKLFPLCAMLKSSTNEMYSTTTAAIDMNGIRTISGVWHRGLNAIQCTNANSEFTTDLFSVR